MHFFENGQKIQKFGVQSDFSVKDLCIDAMKLLPHGKIQTVVVLQKKSMDFLKNNQRTISRKSERDLIRVFENVSDYNLGL